MGALNFQEHCLQKSDHMVDDGDWQVVKFTCFYLYDYSEIHAKYTIFLFKKS